MAKYFVRFKSETDTQMAFATASMFSTEAERPYRASRDPHLLIAELGPEHVASAKQSGADVYEDVLFSPVDAGPLYRQRGNAWKYWEAGAPGFAAAAAAPQVLLTQPPIAAPASVVGLNEVAAHVRAPQAWNFARGAGVTVAIVDTGVINAHAEFPTSKQSPHSVSFSFSNPWDDTVGHGSMCACIAAATKAAGGKFNGIAPDATILSARSTLFSTDIYKLYDRMIQDFENGLTGPLVISNSYGMYTCTAPNGLPQDHPYLGIVREAVSKGIVVVFAAGNNHADVLCNNPPTACAPNTIWGVNSVDEVIAVGTVNQAERNDSGDHANSSRGPGQWAVARTKPDVVAPTYGQIIWGGGYRVMSWWGTSGACPQVAGLSALLLSAVPTLTPANVASLVISTARPLSQAPTCVGAGIIDCEAAVKKALGIP